MTKPIKLTKDRQGESFYPATTTDAVVHPGLRKNLTDIIDDINTSGVPIVESVDALDPDAEQGSLASVAVNTIAEISFSELYQPTSDEVNMGTMIVDTTNLSSVSGISVSSSYDVSVEIQDSVVALFSKDFDEQGRIGQMIVLLPGGAMISDRSTQTGNMLELFTPNEDGTITINEENLATLNNLLSSTEFVYGGVASLSSGEFRDPTYADIFYTSISSTQKTDLYIKDVEGWRVYGDEKLKDKVDNLQTIVDNLEDKTDLIVNSVNELPDDAPIGKIAGVHADDYVLLDLPINKSDRISGIDFIDCPGTVISLSDDSTYTIFTNDNPVGQSPIPYPYKFFTTVDKENGKYVYQYVRDYRNYGNPDYSITLATIDINSGKLIEKNTEEIRYLNNLLATRTWTVLETYHLSSEDEFVQFFKEKAKSKITNIYVKNEAGWEQYSELVDGSVTTEKVVDGAIATAKMADKAVTMAKLADEVQEAIDNAGGGMTEIPDGGVTAAKIANGAVTNAKVATGAIKMANLADEVKTQLGVNTPEGAVAANAIYYDNTASGLESANAQGAIDEISGKTDKKLDRYYLREQYLVANNPKVTIEKGKCLFYDYSVKDNASTSLYTIELDSDAKYLFLMCDGFSKKDSYYCNAAVFDEDMVIVHKYYTGYQVVNEGDGGVIGLNTIRANASNAGNKPPKYFVFSLYNNDPIASTLAVVQGEYTPFFDIPAFDGAITTFQRKCYRNYAADTGLWSQVGLNSLPNYNQKEILEDNENHAIAINRYIYDEDDGLMQEIGIRKCVRFGIGEYACGFRADKKQRYGIKLNTPAKGSTFKVMFIVEVDDDIAENIISSLMWTIPEISMNLNPKYSFNRARTFIKKLQDRYYLVGKYLSSEGGYTESNQGKDAILYSCTIHIYTTSLDQSLGFHGGWICPCGWERNSIRDFSTPSIDQLKVTLDVGIAANEVTRVEDKYNPWKNRSVLAIGTSYMHPNSKLAEKTSEKILCTNLQNNGNVGGATRGVVGSGANGWKIGMSLTNAELKEASDNGVANGSWMSTAILGYENLIMRYICDDNGYVDSLGNTLYRPEGYPRPSIMLVLDGHNEEHTPDVELTGVFGSKEQRGTYRGAWNYLLTEIYKVHPDLKVIFLSNPGIVGETGYEGLNVYEDNKKVVEQWNLPYVDFVTQLGVVNDYRKGDLTIYKADWGGEHYTNRCAERMAQILAAYLKGFVF